MVDMEVIAVLEAVAAVDMVAVVMVDLEVAVATVASAVVMAV